ncbi:hemolysin family protein [Brachybacterium sp. p3-SID1565]|uniref:HlyC/CorC family transporter n=1 Tax=Brachybacterium epidermidis TaxID=2781983 RepID=A0ABR9VY75_9MICO|nr:MULTISPECIES: hemolysin family protein [Brachybacterium]MBE9403136.1 HlyC/CorC family transporter [Brachybacterium epidermidis]MCT1386409.1 hemolysin family protein [Brachybacterium sp. p3-SID1565]MCT1775201.1 hemolysin family protein [Brachybacterium sp. p3-SID957]
MSTDPVFVTVATILLLIASAFFVVIEFALLGARQHRLEEETGHSASARAALKGMHELTIMLAGAQLGITLCTFALGAITKPGVDAALGPLLEATGLPSQVAGTTSFVLSLLLVTFLHLVVGEMAPKSWAIAAPETAAKVIAIPSRVFIAGVRPLLTFVNAVANRLVAASGFEPMDRAAVGGHDAETIRQLVEHSGEQGVLEQEFRDQISEVLDLADAPLCGLIDPADRATAVDRDATVADLQAASARTGHKRILVRDLDADGPGVIHVRDTLLEDSARPVAELARPAFRLQGDTPVLAALTMIRGENEQLAAVMDGEEFLGVVTSTDIMRKVLPRREPQETGA